MNAIIRHLARLPEEELQKKIDELTAQLSEVDMVTQTTVGGNSYTRQQREKVTTVLNRYLLALEYQRGESYDDDLVQSATPMHVGL